MLKFLVNQLIRKSKKYNKYTFSYTDFSTTSASNTIDLFTLNSKEILERIVVKHTTAFSGGTSTSANITVGISGQLDKYASSFNVFQTVGDTVFQLSDSGFLEDFTNNTTVKLTLEIEGDTLDNLTAGEVEIYTTIQPLVD